MVSAPMPCFFVYGPVQPISTERADYATLHVYQQNKHRKKLKIQFFIERGKPWKPVHLADMMSLEKSFVQVAAPPYRRNRRRPQPRPAHAAAGQSKLAQLSACIAAARWAHRRLPPLLPLPSQSRASVPPVTRRFRRTAHSAPIVDKACKQRKHQRQSPPPPARHFVPVVALRTIRERDSATIVARRWLPVPAPLSRPPKRDRISPMPNSHLSTHSHSTTRITHPSNPMDNLSNHTDSLSTIRTIHPNNLTDSLATSNPTPCLGNSRWCCAAPSAWLWRPWARPVVPVATPTWQASYPPPAQPPCRASSRVVSAA